MIKQLSDILSADRVLLTDCPCKNDVLDMLCEKIVASGCCDKSIDLPKAIRNREKLMSTGIGLGLGIPHVRIDGINRMCMAAAICRNPVTDYESIDNKPVRLLFMIVAAPEQHAEYISTLCVLSSSLKDAALRKRLMDSTDTESAWQLLSAMKESHCR